MNATTEKQIALLHHTLGLTPERRAAYRNNFLAGDGHHDQADLVALHAAGLMTRTPAAEWMGGGEIFRATDAGKSLALDQLAPPPKYSRYEDYLRSECCESFAEWLGIDVPKREYNYYSNGPTRDWVRLKSSKGTGEYCKTLKDAKVSYKATVKKLKARDAAVAAAWAAEWDAA